MHFAYAPACVGRWVRLQCVVLVDCGAVAGPVSILSPVVEVALVVETGLPLAPLEVGAVGAALAPLEVAAGVRRVCSCGGFFGGCRLLSVVRRWWLTMNGRGYAGWPVLHGGVCLRGRVLVMVSSGGGILLHR